MPQHDHHIHLRGLVIGDGGALLCPFCHEPPGRKELYKINSEGGYGLPELWACYTCMRDAEPGGRLAKIRDEYHAEDFP